MGRILTGHFEADGNLVNLVLGAVPDYIRVTNAAAADTEVQTLEWWKEMGDEAEIWHYIQDNDGGGDVTTPVKKTSTDGYIKEYDDSFVGDRVSVTFDYTGGASEDLVTAVSAMGHPFSNGERVMLVESGGLAAGLYESKIYYVIDATATTFRLSLTSGGSAVAMTSDGTAPNYVRSVDNIGERGGGKGVTIEAAFMDDGDEVYYYAVIADRSQDHGDINA